MSRSYSDTYKQNLSKLSCDDYPVVLLQIDHDDLASPVRVVNDTENITSNSNTYSAIAFSVRMPDDKEESHMSTAVLRIDNAGRDLISWLEASNGGRGATITLSQILRSDPDTVEQSYVLDVSSIIVTQYTVDIELTTLDVVNMSAVNVRYTPSNYPGVF